MEKESRINSVGFMRSRRDFLRICGVTVPAILGAGVLLSACGGGNKKESDESNAASAGLTNCGDLSGVSEAELEKRKSLGYVEETPMPESHCGNCLLYLLPEKEGTCGGCQLFKGPVFEQGYCTYWAAKA